MIDIRKNWYHIVYAILGLSTAWIMYTTTEGFIEYSRWFLQIIIFMLVFGIVNTILVFKKTEDIK